MKLLTVKEAKSDIDDILSLIDDKLRVKSVFMYVENSSKGEQYSINEDAGTKLFVNMLNSRVEVYRTDGVILHRRNPKKYGYPRAFDTNRFVALGGFSLSIGGRSPMVFRKGDRFESSVIVIGMTRLFSMGALRFAFVDEKVDDKIACRHPEYVRYGDENQLCKCHYCGCVLVDPE